MSQGDIIDKDGGFNNDKISEGEKKKKKKSGVHTDQEIGKNRVANPWRRQSLGVSMKGLETAIYGCKIGSKMGSTWDRT